MAEAQFHQRKTTSRIHTDVSHLTFLHPGYSQLDKIQNPNIVVDLEVSVEGSDSQTRMEASSVPKRLSVLKGWFCSSV